MVVSEDSEPEAVGQSGSWAQGLAKGVFSHKRRTQGGAKRKLQSPAGKRARKRSRVTSGGCMGDDLSNEFLKRSLASRSGVWLDERVEGYNTILSSAKTLVSHLQEEIFTGVFDSIVQFAKDIATLPDTVTIPTAVLLTGVNMPDHLSVFSLLISKLRTVSPHVSLVGPNLSLKALVSHLVVELTTLEGEEETVKKSDASLSLLSTWYSNQYSGDERPPLIVILQDFEGSAGPALQDLITLLGRYSNLPFMLVFGVATTLTTVHRALSQAATARLTIHTFGSPPATLHLDQIIDKVLINPDIPFKLDCRVFKFLVENFLYHDFAVRHFMEGFKFILGEHFYRTPTSLFCCDLPTSLSRLEMMDNKKLDFVRRLPSFRRYVEQEMEVEQQAEVLVSAPACKELVRQLLTELVEQQRLFTVLVRSLFHLTHDLPRRPLGKMLRVTYELCLSPSLQTTPHWKEAWRYLQLSSRPDLERKLDKLLTELRLLDMPKLTASISGLTDLLTRLSDLATDPQQSTGPSLASSPAVTSLTAALSTPSGVSPLILPSSLPPSALSTPMIPPSALSTPMIKPSALSTPLTSTLNTPIGSSQNTPSVLPTKLDRFNLKQSLLALKEKTKVQPPRPFDLLRTEVLTSLQTLFTTHLTPISCLPLHEVVTFSSLGAVKRHLVGAPRAALHTALTQPGEYLEHKDLEIQDPGEIPATFPDIAVGYKLHLECPRLINVYDWLTCWNAIVTGGELDEQVGGVTDTVSDTNQARFTRVVAELQMLGFIKTSSRKTDHVARLTFGGS